MIWLINGFILGGLLANLIPQARRARVFLLLRLVELIRLLLDFGFGYPVKKAENRFLRVRLAMLIADSKVPAAFAVIMLLIAISILMTVDARLDWSWLLALDGWLAGFRLRYFALGLLFGFIFWTRRLQILQFIILILRASEEGKSSDVFMYAFAFIFFVLAIVAIKPKLLDKVESFRAGEFEAHFTSVQASSSAASEALSFDSAEFYRSNTLDDWKTFSNEYGCRDNPAKEPTKGAIRNIVRMKISGNEEENNRRQLVACAFFPHVSKLIDAIASKRTIDEIENCRRHENLVRVAYLLRSFIIDPKNNGDDLRAALDRVDHVEFASSCGDEIEGRPSFKGAVLGGLGANMFRSDDVSKTLKKDEDDIIRQASENPRNVDPYVVAFVGDTLGFYVDADAEASFISTMRSRFPATSEDIHPGIVALYFQAADTKFRSHKTWPFNNLNRDLEDARRINDLILSKSEVCANKPEICKSKSSESEEFEQVTFAYMNNEAIIDFEFLELIMGYQLNGGHPDAQQQAAWTNTHSRLAGIVNARDETHISIAEASSDSLPPDEQQKWRKIKIESSDLMDIYSGLALSAALLSDQDGKSTPEGCATARYYLLQANRLVPNVAEKLSNNPRGQNDVDRERHEEYVVKLNGYLSRFDHRIAAGCAE